MSKTTEAIDSILDSTTTEEYQENVRKAIDVVSMDLMDLPLVKELEKDEQNELLRFTSLISRSRFWKIIMKEHTEAQKDAAVMNAENYDIVTFHRAVIVAFSLINEFLVSHANQYEGLSLQEKTRLDEKDKERYNIA